jgi:hypothetical protein
MNPRCRNMVISVAILRGVPQGRSHPRGKGPVPDDSSEKEAGDLEGSSQQQNQFLFPKKIEEDKRLPRVINLRNSERPNLPPSMVR